jgi:hypothetical protein
MIYVWVKNYSDRQALLEMTDQNRRVLSSCTLELSVLDALIASFREQRNRIASNRNYSRDSGGYSVGHTESPAHSGMNPGGNGGWDGSGGGGGSYGGGGCGNGL